MKTLVTNCQSNQYLGTSLAIKHIGCRHKRIGGLPHQSPPMEEGFSLYDQMNQKDLREEAATPTIQPMKPMSDKAFAIIYKLNYAKLALVDSPILKLSRGIPSQRKPFSIWNKSIVLTIKKVKNYMKFILQ